MSRLSHLASWASRHRRLLGAVQLIVLVVFFGAVAWVLRGSVHGAVHDLKNANVFYFALGCAALAAYYLVFVLGWIGVAWIIALGGRGPSRAPKAVRSSAGSTRSHDGPPHRTGT